MSQFKTGADYAKYFAVKLAAEAKASGNPEQFCAGALTMISGAIGVAIGGLATASLLTDVSATAVNAVSRGKVKA